MQLEIRQDHFFNLLYIYIFLAPILHSARVRAIPNTDSTIEREREREQNEKNNSIRTCSNKKYGDFVRKLNLSSEKTMRLDYRMCVWKRSPSFIVWIFSRWREIKIELCHFTTEL